MNNDRFVYKKGDIQLGKTQCDFCAFNISGGLEAMHDTCDKFKEEKPTEIVKGLVRCPFLTLNDESKYP